MTKTKRLKILLVGGGTGGHIYPLVEVAKKLRVSERSVMRYYHFTLIYDILGNGVT